MSIHGEQSSSTRTRSIRFQHGDTSANPQYQELLSEAHHCLSLTDSSNYMASADASVDYETLHPSSGFQMLTVESSEDVTMALLADEGYLQLQPPAALINYPLIGDAMLARAPNPGNARDVVVQAFTNMNEELNSVVAHDLTSTAERQHERPLELDNKGKQREIIHQTAQALSSQQVLDQRKNRCLCCMLDRGKRGCRGRPICNSCWAQQQTHIPGIRADDTCFIEWQGWGLICQDLCETSKTLSAIKSSMHDTQNFRDVFSKEIFLEFHFYDRLYNKTVEPHIVIFRPDEQPLRTLDKVMENVMDLRPPAISVSQLDAFVKAEVWGTCLWDADSILQLSVAESGFWDSIRLFLSYYSLLHNFSTTFFQPSDIVTSSVLGRIISEILYTYGYRLQMLYHELMTFATEQDPSLGTSKTFAATKLYGLRVLYVILTAMGRANWGICVQNANHPLTLLQQYFNKRTERVRHQVQIVECIVSDTLLKHRRMRNFPFMVRFSQAFAKTMSFPKHCMVTATSARSIVSCSAPCKWQPGAKYRSVDVLTLVENDTMNLGISDLTATAYPKILIDRDNNMIPFTLDQGGFTGQQSTSFCSSDESKNPQATEAEIMLRSATLEEGRTVLDSPQTYDMWSNDDDMADDTDIDMDDDVDNDMNDYNEHSSVTARSSRLPSLIPPTPFSISAPPTPSSSMTILGVQHGQENL